MSSLEIPAPPHAHDHGAHAVHDHAHSHAQDHGHAHDPDAVSIPGLSLMRLSAAARLAGAATLAALIWAGVWWATR